MSEFSDLLGPGIDLKNKKGEVLFALKRKKEYDYFIFEVHPERCDDDEQRRKIGLALSLIKAAAGQMGVVLFDQAEINQALEAGHLKFVESPEGQEVQRRAEETGKVVFVKDIEISVFNHGSGRINTMTVGISVAPPNYDPSKMRG